MSMSSKTIALILILLGVVSLLGNLGLTDFSFTGFVATYWPAIFVLWGLGALGKAMQFHREGRHLRHHSSMTPLLAIGLGLLLIAGNLNLIEIGVKSIWSIVWPVLLIYVGIKALSGWRRPFVTSEDDWEGFKDEDWRKGKSHKAVSTFIGDISLGQTPFELNDTRYDFTFGDARLDLTNALIPDKETVLDVSGVVGDVEILVPEGIPICVEASLGVGEITICGRKEDGLRKHMSYQAPGYNEAQKKIRLFISLRAGEIDVRSV